MRWSDLPRNPDDRTLRQFAGLWLAFFGGLGLWQGLVRERPALASALIAAALVVGGLGLIRPKAVRPIYVGWMVAAFPIGWVVSHAMLGLLFYGLFTPIAAFFRLTGRDALRRRSRPAGDSYFVPKATPADPASYLRQS